MTTYGYFVRGDKHAALCATSIESVARCDDTARFVVATDDVSTIPCAQRVKVLRMDLPKPIMLANLEAQCRILGTECNQGDRVVFLDTDILLLDPLPWNLSQDLFVTWRDRIGTDEEGNPVVGLAVTMPYNYGVIGVRAGYASLEAFIWMRERIRRMNHRLQSWYGNQVALAALCGPRPESGTRTDRREIPWTPTQMGNPVAITKLPAERWNYTPRVAGERTHGLRSILHFKGGARTLMESYAKQLRLNWYLNDKAAA